MSTQLDVVFSVNFGNIHLLILFLIIHGQKMQFFASSQYSISEKIDFYSF